jgi:hypothetical protein
MQVDGRNLSGRRTPFARFPAGDYFTMPYGLVAIMAERRVASNGWPVMAALCRRIFDSGVLGRCGRDEVAELTGLTYSQIARGMAELRQKEIIVPVIRKTAEGYRHLDRSNFGHVAQYCIAQDIWARIEKESSEESTGT